MIVMQTAIPGMFGFMMYCIRNNECMKKKYKITALTAAFQVSQLPVLFLFHFIPKLGQTQTLHVLDNHTESSLDAPLSILINLHRHTAFDTIRILTFNISITI